MGATASPDSDEARSRVLCAAGDCPGREGETAENIHFVEEGQIELLRGQGAGQRRLALIGPGDFFGEGVLDGSVQPSTARCLTACRLLRVEGAVFRQIVARCPEIAIRMVIRLSRRGIEEPRPSAETPAALPSAAPSPRPRLLHRDSGKEFFLPDADQALIGRADPRSRSTPDLDLSPLDTQRTLSRRHAMLVREGSTYYLTEELRVANGTFVNGDRVKPGERIKLSPGDEVCFGLVKTVFLTD